MSEQSAVVKALMPGWKPGMFDGPPEGVSEEEFKVVYDRLLAAGMPGANAHRQARLVFLRRRTAEQKPLTDEKPSDAVLRAERVRNYRVKRATVPPFGCSEPGCKRDEKILVVRIAEGEEDECFSTRCEAHIGELEPTPGQWNVSLTDE